MASLIRDLMASTPQMLEAFGDEALIAAALAFEAALARASAAEGVISAEAAAAVVEACASATFDPATLGAEAALAGTLAIPLIRQLGGGEALHRGATSQDLADTALMLQARAGAALIERETSRIVLALAALTERHAAMPMLGRTLMQAARPITFGLKTAQWLLGVEAAAARFRAEAATALALQFGGAVGDRGDLDGKGAAIAARMAAELGLARPPPWHARRDSIAGLASALGILTGGVGKIARDISLLSQAEVGEAFEPRTPGRGGSSAMAHKRNPTGCQVALSAALRTPALVSTILAALPQEHERGLGGWQAEAPVLAELFQLAHGALAAMAPVLEGLEVAPAAMARNLAAADVGSDPADAETLARAMLAQHRSAS